jgi:hypothetical protein
MVFKGLKPYPYKGYEFVFARLSKAKEKSSTPWRGAWTRAFSGSLSKAQVFFSIGEIEDAGD